MLGEGAALLGNVVNAADLRDAVAPLLNDPQRRNAMAECALGLGRRDAADRLVDDVLDVAGER
ncbi:hypothetical protein P3102_20640 [Amycolatopsis sp. QT-25]|uniref:hypothetical protein n=1 Tax=Amycolatopsis sp. QT-25 TaxID=3034022 RepID=UPI0023EB9E56|nr:hypothetical protein [Amycolatopsis sp. QT-25]WET76534.1 hypothetical protein P3102_20640 [Amycolatopsis sp. QT-25]